MYKIQMGYGHDLEHEPKLNIYTNGYWKKTLFVLSVDFCIPKPFLYEKVKNGRLIHLTKYLKTTTFFFQTIVT